MMLGPLHVIDILSLVVLVVLAPLWVARKYRRFVARARGGIPDIRRREYRKTIVLQWSLVTALAVWWAVAGRSFVPSLPSPGRLLAGALVTAAVLAILALQWRAMGRMTPEQQVPLRAQIESVRDLLPHNAQEAALFRGLALTAGICEEILYRGYLLWALAPFLGTWGAVVTGGAIFGLAHAYQGKAGILKTGVVGALAGTLYVWGGTLLWPIILHAAIDLQGGAASCLLLETDQGPSS